MDIVDKHARSTTKANRPVRQVWTNCQHSWGRSPTPAHVEIDRRGPAGFFLHEDNHRFSIFTSQHQSQPFFGQHCPDISCKNIWFLQHLLFPGRSMIWQDRGMMFALHAVRERAVSRSRNNFDRYISEFRFWTKGDVESIELCNYAGGVETRLRTEVLWADLFHQIKPWNARWRVRLGSCLLWRRAVCGCAQILYRVPSPRNVISGHTMSNRHVWGQIQNLFMRPFFSLFLFLHLLFSVRLLHIHTSSNTRKGKTL